MLKCKILTVTWNLLQDIVIAIPIQRNYRFVLSSSSQGTADALLMVLVEHV